MNADMCIALLIIFARTSLHLWLCHVICDMNWVYLWTKHFYWKFHSVTTARQPDPSIIDIQSLSSYLGKVTQRLWLDQTISIQKDVIDTLNVNVPCSAEHAEQCHRRTSSTSYNSLPPPPNQHFFWLHVLRKIYGDKIFKVPKSLVKICWGIHFKKTCSCSVFFALSLQLIWRLSHFNNTYFLWVFINKRTWS